MERVILYIVAAVLIIVQISCSIANYRIRRYEMEMSDKVRFRLYLGEALCGLVGWLTLIILVFDNFFGLFETTEF